MTRHTPANSTMPPDSDAYLWDRSGPADALVLRLETLLAPARVDVSAAPNFEAPAAPLATSRPARFALAAAAVIGAIFAVWYFASSPGGPGAPPRPPAPPAPTLAWRIGPITGEAKVSEPVTGKFGPGITARWFETGAEASVQASAAGQTVTIAPRSAGTLVEGPGAADRSVRLEAGSATVIAGKTPASIETSLGKSGSSLRIRIAPDAEARIHLPESGGKTATSGGVLVIAGRADVRDPAGRLLARIGDGMTCPIDLQGGLGTPISAKPSPSQREFAEALAALDATSPEDTKSRYYHFGRVLENAKGMSEAATLWNLLLRSEPNDRGAILKRLEAILIAAGREAPKVDPEAVIRLDEAALDQWWGAITARP